MSNGSDLPTNGEHRPTDPGRPRDEAAHQVDPTGLLELGVRQLDPTRAVRFGHQALASTTYQTAHLLIRPTANEELIKERLTTAADRHGLDLHVNVIDEQLRALATQAGIGADEDQPLVIRVLLLPRYGDDQPVAPPDAWPVLQTYRSLFTAGDPDRRAVQLNHVMNSHGGAPVEGAGIAANPYMRIPGVAGNPYMRIPGVGGNPYMRIPGTTSTPYMRIPGSGNPYVRIPGSGGQPAELAEYGSPGTGGRMPVAWVGPEPTRTPDEAYLRHRRPVVAVLDTGVGDHAWLTDGSNGTAKIIDRRPMCGPLRIGLTDPETAPDSTRVRINDLVGGLDPTAGHGTFIAGLIRQRCPDANLLAVRVIQGDGVVSEADLLEALNMLWLRQKLAIVDERPDQLVDVVSISLGYYHEELGDAEFDPFLLAPLRALARMGVLIVTSAGNDATVRPMYPAAFGPWSGGPVKELMADELPVVAVGATNPDRSVALFSNEGPWVTAYRQGAALVSTMPAFDGSHAPSTELRHGDVTRSTIDLDDFSSGFGIWSGTSFAAPILAGDLAWQLGGVQLAAEVSDPGITLAKAWEALTAQVPHLVRPGTPPDENAESAESAVLG